jgi:N-acetylglutamate synthase-like GNAT family acetyltransferase
MAVIWRYPGETTAVIVSSMPLWVSILLVIVVADYEQQRNWDQYWVVEYQGNLIGCGRLDLHSDHSEIYDLFVLPEWRCHGVGRAIMQQLIEKASRPIYLASLPNATQFYQHLGFKPITPQSLPIFLAGRLSLTSPRYQRVGLQAMILAQVESRLDPTAG